jgi:tetratricopeptide (TPR) repeat protein
MKKIVFILFATLYACFAQESPNASIDSIKANIRNLSADQREIKSSVDSISIKATEKALEVYNKSFEKMQTSFNIFIAALGVLVLVFSWFNLKTTSDLRKDAKEDIEKTKNKIKEFDEKIKEQQKVLDKHQKVLDEVLDDIMENKRNLNNTEKEKLKGKAMYVKNAPDTSPYEKALAKAAEYYYSDDYESALKSYEDILKNYRDEITLTRLSQIYFQMAYSYTEIKAKEKKEDEELFNQAIDKYKEALKWDPKNAKASYNLACLYSLKYGLTKDLSNEDEAFKYLKEALENKERDKGLSFDYVEKDLDFVSLNKEDSRYKELKDKYG